MSVCATGCPGAGECVGCQGRQPRTVDLIPHSGRPAGKKPEGEDEIKELEELLAQMRSIKFEARRLTRSGHPGVAAEGLAALQQAEDNIRWIRARLVEEEAKDA